MARFPVRTLVLMVLALFSFIFMWWQTHLGAAAPKPPVKATVMPIEAAGGDR